MNATRRYSIYNVVYGLPKSGIYAYPVPNEEWACICLRVSWNCWHQYQALYCQCKRAWRHWRCSMPALVFALFYDKSLEINWIIPKCIKLAAFNKRIHKMPGKFPRRYQWSIATLKVTFSFVDCKKSGLAVVKEKCLHVRWSLRRHL